MLKQSKRITQMFFGQLARSYAKLPQANIFAGPMLRAAAAIPEHEYEVGMVESPADIEAACSQQPLAAAEQVSDDSKQQQAVNYSYNYHEYSYYDLKQSAAKLAGWQQNEPQQQQQQEDEVQLILSAGKTK